MSLLIDLLQAALLLSGVVMFAAGTLGLLRFPDTYCRIHALTKADNLGLGLIIAGLMLSAGSVLLVFKLLLIWLLVMLASALSGHLVAWEGDAQGMDAASGDLPSSGNAAQDSAERER
ncbi:cation:proton antiporter [Nitrincola alkalilacustris]|uniref:cation:proton antiporter n=1 Tax=Nitrincola alkalilacustris TaxID=1571224 RepID=UPI00124C09A2|nr:monovalent cation/H(+) antiporter subunit G [Nitrincola alkalilacustris]